MVDDNVGFKKVSRKDGTKFHLHACILYNSVVYNQQPTGFGLKWFPFPSNNEEHKEQTVLNTQISYAKSF
jgi:hypothetical protein